MDPTASGDPTSLWNSSVLLPSYLGVFSYLPTPCPLSSLEQAHRSLRTL